LGLYKPNFALFERLSGTEETIGTILERQVLRRAEDALSRENTFNMKSLARPVLCLKRRCGVGRSEAFGVSRGAGEGLVPLASVEMCVHTTLSDRMSGVAIIEDSIGYYQAARKRIENYLSRARAGVLQGFVLAVSQTGAWWHTEPKALVASEPGFHSPRSSKGPVWLGFPSFLA
jgi:hypothetical protein